MFPPDVGLHLRQLLPRRRVVDPAALSDLALRLDAAAIAGLADGDPVARWDDASGNDRHAGQPVAERQPVYRAAGLNGRPTLRFDGLDDGLTTPSVDLSGSPAVTLYVVGAGTNHGIFCECSRQVDSILNAWAVSRNADGKLSCYAWTGEPNERLSLDDLDETPRLMTVRVDLRSRTHQTMVFLDGSSAGTWGINGAGDPVNGRLPDQPLFVGARDGGVAFALDGQLSELIVYAAAHNPAQRRLVETSLARKWGIAAYQPPLGMIVCEGASNSEGEPDVRDVNYPQQLRAALARGGRYDWFEPAISGQVTSHALADAAATIDPYLSPGLMNVLFVCDLASNAFSTYPDGGQTVAAEQDRYRRYGADRRGAGWKVLVATLLPRSDGAVPPETEFESKRQEFNAWLRAEGPTFCDGVVDEAADPDIGRAGAELDARYFNPDRVHPSEGGHAKRVPYFAAALAEGPIE